MITHAGDGDSATEGLSSLLLLVTTDIVKGLFMFSNVGAGRRHWESKFHSRAAAAPTQLLRVEQMAGGLTVYPTFPEFNSGLARVRKLGQEMHSDLCTAAPSQEHPQV